MHTCHGMAHLHDQGLMHCDLKSLTVLLDDLNRSKLGDFGLARVVGDAQRTMTGGIESMLWMVPGVMIHATYDVSADVYAWGILAWEIMSPEAELFDGVSLSRQVVQGKRPPLQPSWPVGVCEIMVKCWSDIVEERPTFGEVVEKLAPLVGLKKVDTEIVDGSQEELSKPLLRD
jgi:eukaryotic-like serine/threonine-protein kinase